MPISKRAGAKPSRLPRREPRRTSPAFPIRLAAQELRRLLEELQGQVEQLQAQNEQLRAAQRDLEESRDRYAELYDFAPAGYVSLDGKGSILELNLTAAAMLGAERFDLIGKPFQSRLSKLELQKFRHHLTQCRQSTGAVRAELMLADKQGKPLCVQLVTVAAEDPERLAAVFNTSITDITERQRVEQALSESEEQYRLLFQLNPQPMWIYDRGTLGFMAVNDAALHHYGYSREEFLAMTIKDIRAQASGGDPLLKLERLPANALADGPGSAGVWQHRKKDGSIVKVEITPCPLLFKGRNACLILARDVTEEKLKQCAERLEAHTRQLLEVQETERRYIARELHDQVGQVLTALQLSLRMSANQPPDKIKANLEQAEALLNDLTGRVRDLSLDLRPSLLDDLGLLPTLLWHLERYTAQTRVQVTIKHAGLEKKRFRREIETAAYRIVQEALTNVARHAGVDQATVRVWSTRERLHVQIEDHGEGFDPAGVSAGATSGGLIGMRERASLLGGQLTVDSAIGAGTRVTAELALSEPNNEAAP